MSISESVAAGIIVGREKSNPYLSSFTDTDMVKMVSELVPNLNMDLYNKGVLMGSNGRGFVRQMDGIEQV